MANEIKIKITSDSTGAISGFNQVNKDLAGTKLAAYDAGREIEKLGGTLNKTQSDFVNSSKSKKIKISDMVDLKPDPKLGSGIASGIASSMQGAPPLAIAGGIIGVGMAPAILAGVAGAITGAVGLGGVIGGAALAAKDPAVADYATRIGEKFSKSVNASARSSFVAPMRDSLRQVESLADRSAPKIGAIFSSVAPSVSGLTGNITRLADSLLDNLGYAASKSGPAIGALGDLIEHTGESIGGMIRVLADDVPEGVSALHDFDDALQNTIKTITAVIDGGAKMKDGLDWLDRGIDKVRYASEDWGVQMDLTADGYKRGSEAAQLYRDRVIGAAGSTNDYTHYLAKAAAGTSKLANTMTDAEKAAQGQIDSLDELGRALKAQNDPVFALLNAEDKLAKAQKDVAESTKKTGKNSRETKADLRKLAEAAISVETAAGTLGSTFNGKMTPAMRATLRTAGLTSSEINRLGGQFEDARRDGERFAKNYKANVTLIGAEAASVKTRRVRDLLNQLHNKRISVNVIVNESRLSKVNQQLDRMGANYAHGGIKGAASGAISGGLTWTGEQGPELVSLPTGSTVHSAGDSQRMMRQMMNNGGGGATEVMLSVAPSANRDLVTALLSALRYEVTRNGGGSVQRLLGRTT